MSAMAAMTPGKWFGVLCIVVAVVWYSVEKIRDARAGINRMFSDIDARHDMERALGEPTRSTRAGGKL